MCLTTLNISTNIISENISFRDVDADSISILKDFFLRYPTHSCDFSIGGIMLWRDYFNYKYVVVEDTLFIQGLFPDSGEYFFHMPLGLLDRESAYQILYDYASLNSINLQIIHFKEIESDYIDTVSANNLPGWREYLYNIEQFTHFSGKKMEKKRNHLNYFQNNYQGCEVELISDENTLEVICFTRDFSQNHSESNIASYECEACCDMLSNYASYPFIGLLLRYNGRILGYTIGEVIGDICFLHIEKGDINFRGIYQKISSEMALYLREHYPEVKLLNREDDMDVEELRKSKESYHPSCYIVKNLVK